MLLENKAAKIFVAGHRGMVGAALVRSLSQAGFQNLILRTRAELDLTDQAAVRSFMLTEKPAFVFLAAAKVGGILANSQQPAQFLYENLQIQNNVIHAAYLSGVQKLLFLGSSCIYPRLAPQPIQESALLSGPLEPTNEAYAIAKIAGLKLCQAYHQEYGAQFITAMPCNLYGPQDNYDPTSSHVLAALLRKFYLAKAQNQPTVTVWGSGTPLREFMHVDDLAAACLFLMQNYTQPDLINVGSGTEITIRELALLLQEISGFSGEIIWDATKPDGTPRKLMNNEKIRQLGWQPRITLAQGLRQVYAELSTAFFEPPSLSKGLK